MSVAQFVLTSRVIVVALVSCFAIGLPLVVLAASFFRMKCDAWHIWSYAPLAGVGLIILFCQNLVYLDIPVSASSVVIWLLAAAAWAVVLASASMRSMLFPAPFLALGLGILVYLMHGVGLLELGASRYFGYGWVDMFNYTSLAEFLGHYPFHTAATDEGFLQVANYFKNDRIGQSILHAFIMVSAGVDAQQSFAATALLAPCLLFFGLLMLARRLTPLSPISYLATLAGALAPAIATIHFEGFLSQLLSMPFLAVWPLAVTSLVERPGWRTALIGGALLSVIASIYTELAPIALAILGISALVQTLLDMPAFRRHVRLRASPQPAGHFSGGMIVLWSIIAVVVAVAANFDFLTRLDVVARAGSGSVFGEIYPWAYRIEGVARLWFGNQSVLPPQWVVVTVATASLVIVVCNIIGLISWGLTSLSVLTTALALLMFAPLGPLIIGKASGYSYQFYKLLLVVWPLHVFWLVMGNRLFNEKYRISLHYTAALGAIIVALSGGLLIRLAHASTEPSTVATTRRGGADLLMPAEFQELRRLLENTRGREILLLWSDNVINGGEFHAGWLSYFARDNRIRSLVHLMGGSAPTSQSPIASAIVVSSKAIKGAEDKLVFSNPLAFVYDIHSEPEISRILGEARVTISHDLMLLVDEPTDPATWYPVWVEGEPGNASLLTVRFGAFDEFRYDHWGYPVVRLRPEGDCRGGAVRLRIEFMIYDKRMRLTCNGTAVEADIPLRASRFQAVGAPRFGLNALTTSLEGKYPLAERFPGKIMETK